MLHHYPPPQPSPSRGKGAGRACWMRLGWRRRALMIAAISHLSRLARAGFVFAREGVFGLLDPTPMPLPAQTAIKLARLMERPTSASAQGRLAAALTKLGPTYVKLGQFLATRPDVVRVALAR